MSRTSAAWAKLRNQGGSILSPDGDNLTADSDGAANFEAAIKDLCGTHADAIANLCQTIEDAADNAAQLAAMNAIPTTDPKCNSKPIIRLSVGCFAETSWIARNHLEKDCSS